MKERLDVFFETLTEEPKDYIDRLEASALQNGEPVVCRPARALLKYLLRTKKPERVLEIGTAVGYSALFMKEYLPRSAAITTIEKVPARIEQARDNFARYDEHNQIRLIGGDAREILPELSAAGNCYDFIFMDAAKGQYINFLPDVLTMLNAGGVLMSDNILHGGDILQSRYAVTRRDRTIHSRMRQYLKTISSHPCLETICLPVGDGVALSTKIKTEGLMAHEETGDTGTGK